MEKTLNGNNHLPNHHHQNNTPYGTLTGVIFKNKPGNHNYNKNYTPNTPSTSFLPLSKPKTLPQLTRRPVPQGFLSGIQKLSSTLLLLMLNRRPVWPRLPLLLLLLPTLLYRNVHHHFHLHDNNHTNHDKHALPRLLNAGHLSVEATYQHLHHHHRMPKQFSGCIQAWPHTFLPELSSHHHFHNSPCASNFTKPSTATSTKPIHRRKQHCTSRTTTSTIPSEGTRFGIRSQKQN